MKRYIEMDVHRDFIMVGGVTKELQLIARSQKVATREISD